MICEWVARFRDGQKTLGQVIKEVALARDAHWLVAASAGDAGGSCVADTTSLNKSDNGWLLGKEIHGCEVARTLESVRLSSSGNAEAIGRPTLRVSTSAASSSRTSVFVRLPITVLLLANPTRSDGAHRRGPPPPHGIPRHLPQSNAAQTLQAQ